MKNMLIAVSTFVALSCASGAAKPPVVPDASMCAAACTRLHELGCPEGKPIDLHVGCVTHDDCELGQECSPAGTCTVLCTKFCQDTEKAGVWLDPTCVRGIVSCDQIDKCR